MSRSILVSIATILLVLLAATVPTDAFTGPKVVVSSSQKAATVSPVRLNIFGKKEPEEDLSFIETRDMTREEMLDLNKKNEDIMNMELQAMTAFSAVISLPILYLCWVAFFTE